MQLNQVMVYVGNIETSVHFYQSLGLVPIVQSPEYVRFVVPGNRATFSVHLTDKVARSGTVIYFESDNLDEWVEQLKQKGILPPNAKPEMQPWLWREVHLTDPDGNLLCLYHAGENRLNPPWRIKDIVI
ncbi:hypothetical protein C7N43_19110 [Sphingobacteriales bacterium UPWRP_1]|nr:hypothetical protein C7N43_19110 [Sphingobacteriales bacterium UPWRP_1]